MTRGINFTTIFSISINPTSNKAYHEKKLNLLENVFWNKTFYFRIANGTKCEIMFCYTLTVHPEQTVKEAQCCPYC